MTYLDQIIRPTFPPATRFAGYLILAGGFYGIFFGFFWGAFFMLLGTFIAFSRNGLRIDPNQKRFQSYTKLLGLRLGKWEGLGKFCELSILSSTVSTKAYSRTMQETETSSDRYFDLYLLPTNHRTKLLVAREKSLPILEKIASEYSKALGFPLVSFAPKISQSSLQKRRSTKSVR